MRLRRRPPKLSKGRRQRRRDPGSSGSTGLAYRSRRSEQPAQLGRQNPGEVSRAAPKGWGRFLLRRFGLVVLLIALIVSAVNSLSLSSDAKVVSLTTPTGSGSSFLQDTKVYQTAANRLLAGSVWNHNKITVNTGSVSHQMLRQFPELSSVSITLPLLGKRPTVYVQTAQPALLLAASNGSFVIDTGGKALLKAGNPPAQKYPTLPLVTDQSGLKANLNHQALSSADVRFIQIVIAELAARHAQVTASVLPAGASELDIRIQDQPYVVKFNLQSGDARRQAGTFLATQAKLQSQHLTPAEYVDVRVDGRAYYK